MSMQVVAEYALDEMGSGIVRRKVLDCLVVLRGVPGGS